jgi:methylenetetrahydrofolate dehydrogenase (NADP+) / methenyltetrahydrofolate cyclohydrolase
MIDGRHRQTRGRLLARILVRDQLSAPRLKTPDSSMTATILDGKKVAQQIRAELTEEVIDFIQNNSVVPCLAAVLVGDDPASEVYVRNKRRACEEVGIESQLHRLPAGVSQDELLQLVAKLNKDQAVHGILVQMPLPAHVDTAKVLLAVSPAKDVDAFHPENVGRLVQGRPRFLPCTPHGVQQLLMRSGIAVAGRHVVVVGRSDIVGKPLAIMLAQRGPGADATVTICHSRTRDLAAVTRLAEILIVAIGRPKFVTAEMVSPGAVVVDVGINRIETGLVGDVDFAAVCQVAGAITPVPGGVGPLTIAMLLKNTLAAAEALET